MGFGADLLKFANGVEDLANKEARRIGLVAENSLIERTPIDTGEAKGGWNASLGSPDMSTPFKGGPKSKGVQSVRDANAIEAKFHTVGKNLKALEGFGLGEILYITNNVDHIEFLNDGSSEQQPAKFFELTVQEVNESIGEG